MLRRSQKCNCLLKGGDRFVASAESTAATSQLNPSFCLRRVGFESGFETGRRLRILSRIQQGRTQVHPGRHIALIQRDGLLKAGDRSAALFAVGKRDAQVVVGDRKVGLEFECSTKRIDRFHRPAQCAIDVSQAIVKFGPIAVRVDRLPDQVGGRNFFVALKGDDPQQVPGIAVPRVNPQQIAANRLGLAEVSSAVEIEGRLQRW